ELGALDLQDLHAHRAAGQLLEVVADEIDLGALLADQHGRTARVQEHRHDVAGALDLDARDRGRGPLLADVATDLLVLNEEGPEVLLGSEPTRAPRLGDRDAEADRMSLLAHGLARVALLLLLLRRGGLGRRGGRGRRLLGRLLLARLLAALTLA